MRWVSGERGTGAGAFPVGDAGGQPDGASAGAKTGATKKKAARNGEKNGVKKQNVIILGLTPSRMLKDENSTI